MVAASLDAPLGWKFLWIYMAEYTSRCMHPQGCHMAWQDLVLKPSTVFYHDCVTRWSWLQCSHCQHPAHFDPENVSMLIENIGNQPTSARCQQPKTTPRTQSHLTILATDYQQWDYPWWTLLLWFLPRSDDCGFRGWQKSQINLFPGSALSIHNPQMSRYIPTSVCLCLCT